MESINKPYKPTEHGASCDTPVSVFVCNQLDLQEIEASLNIIAENQETTSNLLQEIKILQENQLQELLDINANVEEIDLHVVINTEEITDALDELQQLEITQTTQLSNQLTTITNLLTDMQTNLNTDNQELKDKLDEIITQLTNLNNKVVELIEFDKPTTVSITIPETIPLVFNPMEYQNQVIIYPHGGSHVITNKGLKFTGYETMYFKQRLPVNHNIKYILHAEVEGSNNARLTGGQVSYANGSSLWVDQAPTMQLNTSLCYNHNFSGELRKTIVIGDYNAQSEDDVLKFDPIADEFRYGLVLNSYGEGSTSGVITVKKMYLRPIEGTFKIEKGSVTYFFDKNGNEVLAKRIFRKDGIEIEEPKFWYEGEYITNLQHGVGDIEERMILNNETKEFKSYKSLTHTNLSGVHRVIEADNTTVFPISGKIDGDTVAGEITRSTTIDAIDGRVYVTVVY